jgi:hypothetical protein
MVPPRLVDGEAAEMIELGLEAGKAFGKRAVTKRRSSIDDHPGWLALCMGIDDPHRLNPWRRAKKRTRRGTS